MDFDDAVRELLDRCPGARAAAIVDPDGIPVTSLPHEVDTESLGAELASIVRSVDEAGREFDHGPLEQFSIFAETSIVILTTVAAGYFLMLVMERESVVAKARFYSRVIRERLYSEFI